MQSGSTGFGLSGWTTCPSESSTVSKPGTLVQTPLIGMSHRDTEMVGQKVGAMPTNAGSAGVISSTAPTQLLGIAALPIEVGGAGGSGGIGKRKTDVMSLPRSGSTDSKSTVIGGGPGLQISVPVSGPKLA